MVRDAKLTRGPALQPLLRVHCISVGHGQCAAVRRWSLEGRTPYSVCRAYSAVPCGLDDMVDVFFFFSFFSVRLSASASASASSKGMTNAYTRDQRLGSHTK